MINQTLKLDEISEELTKESVLTKTHASIWKWFECVKMSS